VAENTYIDGLVILVFVLSLNAFYELVKVLCYFGDGYVVYPIINLCAFL